MSKSQINQILKTLGYDNLKYNNGENYTTGYSDMGIVLHHSDPSKFTQSIHEIFDGLIKELSKHFKKVYYHNKQEAEFTTKEFKIVVSLRSFSSFGNRPYSNSQYKTYYASIDVESI